MVYDPLPEWELITKRKELPKWWNEIELVPIESEAERIKKSTNKYAGLPGMQAILRCLEDANEPLRFRQIVNTLDRQETSVAGWLHRLRENGSITYETRDRTRYWRRLQTNEISPSRNSKARGGSIQCQLLALLKPNPERWFTLQELQPLLGIRANRIVQSLQSLVRTGEVVCRPDPAGRDSETRRHFYQYRWSDTG